MESSSKVSLSLSLIIIPNGSMLMQILNKTKASRFESYTVEMVCHHGKNSIETKEPIGKRPPIIKRPFRLPTPILLFDSIYITCKIKSQALLFYGARMERGRQTAQQISFDCMGQKYWHLE